MSDYATKLIEDRWRSVWQSSPAAKYGLTHFHATDWFAKQGDFKALKDETKDASEIENQLISVVESVKHDAQEIQVNRAMLDRCKFKELKTLGKVRLLQTPDHMCAYVCLAPERAPISRSDSAASPNTISMYYDAGESGLKFFKRLHDMEIKPHWLRQIASITSLTALDSPAMQVADLFAWSMYREHTSPCSLSRKVNKLSEFITVVTTVLNEDLMMTFDQLAIAEARREGRLPRNIAQEART